MAQDCLIQGGSVLDPVSGRQHRTDVHIKDGVIATIGPALSPGDTPVYDAVGKLISPGWMDMHVHLREPGFEHKETVKSGCHAAAFGGFTAITSMPNTEPPSDSTEVVLGIKQRAESLPVDVFPVACVSQDRAGEELAPMHELVQAGAVAFSDDGSPVQNGFLMRRALEYASVLQQPIMNHLEDLQMGAKGHMNEGEASARLGIVPVPALSEESMLCRDLLLAELTGGQLHVPHVSTAASVDLLRSAKAKGVNVTAEVCVHHFILTDSAIEESGFSTNTKMHPPLRTAEDVEGLKQGLRDGTIDVICTDHAPHALFEKDVEFTAAPFGIIGLETAWGLTCRHLIHSGYLSIPETVYKLSVAPRKILRIPVPEIQEGAKANLTIFDTTTEWIFKAHHIHSKSMNTPFVGEKMIGKAWAVYNKGQLVDNSDQE